LFGNPAALLLDEPTNNLDLDSVHWLQDYLHEYEGVLIVISHDRHFLNTVCTHTADIDYETIIQYVGGYDEMVVAKTSVRARIEKRAAGEEDRATARVYRAVLGGHAFRAGHFAEERSGTAANDGTGQEQHSAAVHPLRYEEAVGAASAGVQVAEEIVRRPEGD